jgi:hypothetical protein
MIKPEEKVKKKYPVYDAWSKTTNGSKMGKFS